MLSGLYIENIAVIERAELEFHAGFNVLTGETGAGKSMIIDALNAVLGERVSRDLVRTGTDGARVTAVFEALPEGVLRELEKAGYAPEEDGTLLIQRTIAADGKGQSRIGGRPATVTLLREIGRMLVNMHGQHENQALLAVERHLEYLDRLGNLAPLRERYAESYHRYCALRRELRRLDTDEDAKQRRTELLRFQTDEIESAALQPGEEESLRQRRDFFRNSERILSALEQAQQALSGDDEEDGAVTRVSVGAEALSAAAALWQELEPLSERVQALSYELQECGAELRTAAENMGFDGAERDEVEARLALIRRLTTKYGGSVEEVLAFAEACRQELSGIEHSEERQNELMRELDAEEEQMLRHAEALTQARRQTAQQFEQRVTAELAFLDMPRVTLSVSLEPTALTASGADRVEFRISANPGEPPKSIAKIASGGELSRIMLAIKSVMADTDDIDTLVFDEIDTGISGRAAQKVGLKLRETASSSVRARQILCVTHLAQIAAMGHHHLLIEKQVRDGRTYTEVRPLDREGRRRELARIISGEVTEASLQAAEEMLHKAE